MRLRPAVVCLLSFAGLLAWTANRPLVAQDGPPRPVAERTETEWVAIVNAATAASSLGIAADRWANDASRARTEAWAAYCIAAAREARMGAFKAGQPVRDALGEGDAEALIQAAGQRESAADYRVRWEREMLLAPTDTAAKYARERMDSEIAVLKGAQHAQDSGIDEARAAYFGRR